MSTANEKFIERIKNFGIIYDKKNINYSNTKEREKVWAILSLEFNCDAKKKWVRLRDKYVRGKRNVHKISGTDDEFLNQSEFNSQMSFLEDHIKIRKKVNDNVNKEYDPFFEETEMEDVKSFYNDFCMEITAPNSSENICHSESSFDTQTKSKRQKFDPIQENFMETLKIFQDKMQNLKTKEEKDDEDTFFLRLVGTKMKKMSNVEKSRFQLEMLRKADEITIKK